MRTYEDFLNFLEEHLQQVSDFIATSDEDFRAVCSAVARFLLSEPFRWESLIDHWPKLPQPTKPSQNELIEFFKNNKGLPLSFKKELDQDDFDCLFQAYNLMYPIFILKDDFYTSIFRNEIRARKYKKIFKESGIIIPRIIEKISRLKKEKSFIDLVRKFTSDLSGFSITLINNKKLLDQVVDKLAGTAAN